MALSKKDKRIYLRAAERISIGMHDHACVAINGATREIECEQYNPKYILQIKFEEYFCPENEDKSSGWFGDHTEENQLARSLALFSMLYCEE